MLSAPAYSNLEILSLRKSIFTSILAFSVRILDCGFLNSSLSINMILYVKKKFLFFKIYIRYSICQDRLG